MSIQEQKVRRQQVQSQINKLEKQLTHFPPGHIICIQNGKYIKMQHILDGKPTTISTKNQEFAKKLMQKKYLDACLHDLNAEKKAIDSYIQQYQHYTSKVDQLLQKPAYEKMLNASMKPMSQELADWAAEPFETNPSHPEQLRHSCMSGHIVRSKSEALIDQSLYTHQIPFRYECQLKLGEVTVFPDFTVRHPQSGEFFIWEHFGKIDTPSYAQNAFQKMQLYTASGYIPTINLITTYETKDHPLTAKKIEDIVQQYFL